MHKTALIIFAKRPALGHGKQRLAEETNSETALFVARALLAYTLDMVKNVPYDLILSPSNAQDSEWSHSLLDRNVICIPQRVGSLGERLMQVDREVRMLGYSKTLFIGTDAPLLSAYDLKCVNSDLNDYQQVFIPASDGGVVLMATGTAWIDLDKIEWSTEKVFQQLKSIAITRGLSVRILSEQTDLDDLTAFKELRPHLHNTKISEILETYL